MLKTEKVNSDQRKQSLQKNLQSSQTLGWSVAAARRLQLWLDIEPKVFQLNVKEVFFVFQRVKWENENKSFVRRTEAEEALIGYWVKSSVWLDLEILSISISTEYKFLTPGTCCLCALCHIFMSFIWMTSNLNPRKQTIDLSLPAGSPRPHGPVDILPF